MKRTIVQPADLAGAPLDEFKQWLGISRHNEDAQLIALLQASLEMCEAFTGQIPLEAVCEETLANQASGGNHWQCLSTRPIRAITSVNALSQSGAATPLDISDYEIDLKADGVGLIRFNRSVTADRVVVRFVAGIAPDWPALPNALRHGIIRLASHHYRDRDSQESLAPPASVAALWRAWRIARIA